MNKPNLELEWIDLSTIETDYDCPDLFSPHVNWVPSNTTDSVNKCSSCVKGEYPLKLVEKRMETWYICKKCGKAMERV